MALHPKATPESTDVLVRAQARDDLPILSTSQAVVQEMELVTDGGIFRALMALIRAKCTMWMEERMRLTIVRRLLVRQILAEKQRATIQAETGLRNSIVAGMTDDQKRMLEYNIARRQRLLSDLQNAESHSASGDGGYASPVSPHMTKEQIDAFALKAVMNLGADNENDDEWVSYRAQLYQQLPPNLASEVEKRIRALWSTLH